MVILQLGVIFAFLAVGELIVWFFDVPIPSSILGMILLTVALKCRFVRLRHVEKAADFMVGNLGFFFVPAGVSVMLHFSLIREQWIPIVVASVVSTLVVFDITGRVHQFVRRLTRKYQRHVLPSK